MHEDTFKIRHSYLDCRVLVLNQKIREGNFILDDLYFCELILANPVEEIMETETV